MGITLTTSAALIFALLRCGAPPTSTIPDEATSAEGAETERSDDDLEPETETVPATEPPMAAPTATVESPNARAVCVRAGNRFAECLGNLGTPNPENVSACANDPRTVAMYTECLPAEDCPSFLQCMNAYVERTAPPPSPRGDTRVAQCESYLQDSERGIALQVAIREYVESGLWNSPEANAARSCVLNAADDAISGCLDEAEQRMLRGTMDLRRRDCLGWDPALAACVMQLPEASNCDDDDIPLWRSPD